MCDSGHDRCYADHKLNTQCKYMAPQKGPPDLHVSQASVPGNRHDTTHLSAEQKLLLEPCSSNGRFDFRSSAGLSYGAVA